MAFAHDLLPHGRYRHVFDIPPARKAKAKKPTREESEHERLIECEFSEIGRDPRFPAGWYIMPGVLLGLFLIVAVMLL
ncbi:MAG TPA: hypothetical protein VN723_08010 [Rhizomicrobium sp.]|jgi:hypothetical protein|nr:hypothetical protein [Rhizomicrobium sp.]